MSQLVKHVFEQVCSDLVIDANLAKAIIKYQLSFSTKNDQHIQFFGGHLTGVQVVRFTDQDRQLWFEDILKTDEDYLQKELLKLPTVHEEHKVASNAMNLSCAYLVHALTVSSIPEPLKHDAIIATLLVLQYKFLTSRLYRHFVFPADRATAEATFASLSLKFDLKQAGSWGALLNQRAENIVLPNALWVNLIKTFDDDSKIEKFLNDVQTRLRSLLNIIAGVHYSINKQGKRITAVSATVEHDGKEVLRDRTKSLAVYTRYLNAVITDKGSFIREELTSVVENLIHTMPPQLLHTTLAWMSDNYQSTKSPEVENVVKETLIHSFDYLSHDRAAMQSTHDLPGLLTRLRGVYTAARSTDPALMFLREEVEKIVKKATNTKNVSLLAPTRTGVLLYLVLRALCKNYYSGQ